MTPARLLILIVALAVIANARVPLFPGWTVPVPVVLLAVMACTVAALAALIVLRLYPCRPGAPAASTTRASDGPAVPAVAS